jgi:hypothetical protein
MSPDLPPINCPRCGMANQVQKVSALVAAGTVHSAVSVEQSGEGFVRYSGGQFATMTTYGHTYHSSSQQTQLSLRLSPPGAPLQPLQPRPASGWSADTVSLLVVFSVLGACSLGGATYTGMDTYQASAFLVGILLALLFAIAIVAVILYGINREGRKREAWQAKYAQWQVEHAWWQAEYARWQAAKAKLDALYYCRRDDVVFFPGNPAAIPVDSMWTVL